MTGADIARLPEALLPWYAVSARDLPWRADREPYHVWLSEIMLQQTRVEAVRGYYARFLAALPDIPSLAAASEEQLLKLWEGLGYYSRARQLGRAARVIMDKHNGVFPRDYADIRALPGIGDYTAGAILSIAFGQCVPAVDGNVLRVASRITGSQDNILDSKTRSRFRALMADTIPHDRPGEFNQALMDLGATVCLPSGEPVCSACPAREFCTAYAQNRQKELPVRISKTKRRTEEKTVFLLLRGDEAALRQRPDTGLLAGLWEYPHVEGTLDEADAAKQLDAWGITPHRWVKRLTFHHIFTHIRWDMTGYVVEVTGDGPADWLWCDENDRTRRAVPAAFEGLTRELPQG